MNTHADKKQENKSQSVSNGESQMQSGGESTFQFEDNRPEAVAQRKLQEMSDNSPQVSQLKAIQDMANNSPRTKQATQFQAMVENNTQSQILQKKEIEEEPIQENKEVAATPFVGAVSNPPPEDNPIQKKVYPERSRRENNTGLPDNLKTGMENLSGMSLDDVKVHRNSDKPAQLQAHAYAQGADIHLGAGQEKHLPHEAWHVVQQKQGRVKPTMQMKDKVNINDDAGLEKEADVMGAKALKVEANSDEPIQNKTIGGVVAQLSLKRAKVYGVTHLVKMVDGSLYNDDFQENEGQQLNDGDIVEIETDSKVGSRRGPNQEEFNAEDETGPQHYMWYLVKSLNGEQITQPLYIREDTFNKMSGKLLDQSADKTEAVLDSIASGSGITGDFGDINLVGAPDKYSGDHMSQEGGAKLNNPYFDIGEGANIGLGAINVHGAVKKFKEGEKVDAVAQGLEGTGQIAHGGTKLVKGIALLKGGDSAKWTRVGDIGASIGDGLSTITNLISIFKTVDDALNAEGGLTGDELVDTVAETAENVVGYFQSGMNTGKDILKAATDVGAGNPAIQAEIAQFAQVSAILGIVTGSIQIIHGGIQGGRALYKSGQIQEVKKPITEALISLETEKIPAITKKMEFMGEHLDRLYQEGPIPDFLLRYIQGRIKEIKLQMNELKTAFVQLEGFYNENAPAMDAMRKIQSRHMEKAGMKMAQGTTAVVSSALLLSGVGAPIAVGVAAIGGILTLGGIGLQWKRNAAAGRVQTVASRLDDNGQPTGRIEPEYPDYQVMESRMYKSYYLNLKSTLQDQNFPGLKENETVEVKRFGWGDKKSRLKSKDHLDIDSVGAVDGVSDSLKREKWIQVKDSKGKVTHKEKPKGMVKAAAKITASAHKSKASMEASAKVIADALYRLGMGSYKDGTFVNCKVVPVNIEDGVDMDQLTKQTSAALLNVAGINAKRWEAWLKDTGGDEAKMKEKIVKQVAG